MYRLLIIVAAVSCSDFIQGPEGGRKIYDEDKEASPAIWKQINRVTVKANDTEVISRIVVTDLRPDKDGEATIVAGGQGQKNVTIELRSPTILRGYSFHVDVFATDDQEYLGLPQEPIPSGHVPLNTDKLHPSDVINDTHVNGDEKGDESQIVNAQTPVITTEALEAITEESTTGASTGVTRKARNVVYESTAKDGATTRNVKDPSTIGYGKDHVTKSKATTETGSILTVENSTTHSENATTHAENSTTHAEGSTTHAINSTTHVENSTTPVVNSIHEEHSTTHVVSSTTPAVSPTPSISPVEGSTASVVNSTTARA